MKYLGAFYILEIMLEVILKVEITYYRHICHTVFLSRFGAFIESSLMFAKFQSISYKQHHTMDYMQTPTTYSKSLALLSKVSIYVNEHISAIRMKSP